MKTSISILTLLFFVVTTHVQSQTKEVKYFFNRLPSELKLENSLRKYKMTTDYLNYDLKGNFIQKSRFTGLITYGLENNQVKWNQVRLSHSNQKDESFPNGKTLDYMENFSYIPGPEAVNESFFASLPQAEIQVRNLIWDMLMFDCFAYWDWDSLELNKEYLAENLNGTVELAGQGTFSNHDIRLTWTGITEKNGETCAIIKYAAMNNPLQIEFDNFSMSGRSHYWGDIFVSLEDKQVEHGSMAEDVITDVNVKGQPSNHLGYTVRYITLEKIK